MEKSDSLTKISGLIESATSKCRYFLDKCAEAKFMAIESTHQAERSYISLAMQMIDDTSGDFEKSSTCIEHLKRIQYDLNSGNLGSSLLNNLKILRKFYFKDILRPAINQYLTGDKRSKEEIEQMYEYVIRLNGLVETLGFLTKL